MTKIIICDIINGVIHTCVLSLLCCLSLCFYQSSPFTQKLISSLKNINNEKINSNGIWNNFLIGAYGLIETEYTYNNCNHNDESVQYDQIFGISHANTNTIHHATCKIERSDNDITSPSLPSSLVNNILNNVINNINNYDNDYQDLFKSPTVFHRSGFVNDIMHDINNQKVN